MAYYLYKKIRDKKRSSGEAYLLDQHPKHNAASAGITPAAAVTSELQQQREETPEETQQEEQAKKTARKYRWRLIGGLFLPATVQALNTTLIAGALPFIASDFHQFAQINWVRVLNNFSA